MRNLRFEGIRFAHCAWPLPPGGYAESQATMHDVRHGDPNSPTALIPAAVTFDAAERCALDQCRFEHLGGTAVWFRRACRNNRLSKCRISDVAGNGVNVGEPQVNVPSPEAIAAGRALGPVSQGNAISHNRIDHCGAVFHGAVGVWIGMAKATEVSSNEIKSLPYTGISVGWNWSPAPTVCEGHLIASNHIHHVMQLLSDGGGIYTLGRQPGTILRGNVIHDVPVNAGRAESNGIFMDEGIERNAGREQRDLQCRAEPDPLSPGWQEHAARQPAREQAEDAALPIQQHRREGPRHGGKHDDRGGAVDAAGGGQG